MIMKTGKVPENVLKRSVLRQIGGNGAGIGKDCAFFPFAGEGKLVSCMQEAVVLSGEHGGGDVRSHAEAFMTMSDLIQKCANNLAAGGARPAAVMITLLLPEDTQESMLRGLMEEAAGKCRELDMEIAGGQSRITGAAAEPVAVVTGIGKIYENEWNNDRILPGKAAPGQDIVLSKWIGLQGTAVVARRNLEKLLVRYPAYLVEEAAGFDRYLSVLPEAEIAVKNGVCAMHDASEGGIAGALWEFAEGAGVGLTVEMRKLPLRQETVEVCECCNVNPYELMSGGCLIMACRDGLGLAGALEAEGIPAAVVGKVTDSRDRILVNGDEIRYMNRPERDGVYNG